MVPVPKHVIKEPLSIDPYIKAYVELGRGSYLRSYMYDFIMMLASNWDRDAIERMMRTSAAQA